ncbi:hypothetical protein WA158_008201 [Blastocystis sp. Blastoise]
MESKNNNTMPESGEQTFGARLEELENAIMEDRAEEEAKEKELEQKRVPLPTTGSLEGILVQSIQTEDSDLLESVLNCRDQDVIDDTISRLPVANVFPLLELLVERLEKNPRRANILLIWIKTILLKHSSYLMSVPELSKKVEYLHRLLENRVNSFKKLQKLTGRIELIMSHVQDQENSTTSVSAKPLLTIHEDQLAQPKQVNNSNEEDDDDDDDDNENESINSDNDNNTDSFPSEEEEMNDNEENMDSEE